MVSLGASALVLAAGAEGKAIRGWLSDEQCARGRAASGVYTGTNPDCARQCVAKGAKIVLILPEARRILLVKNQEAAKANIGDYVEVTGAIDAGDSSIRIASLKLVTPGRAMCGMPAEKPAK